MPADAIAPAPGPERSTRALGGVAGLLAAAAGVAVSEAVAGVLTGETSPLLAVVDRAPRPLKYVAIDTFGTAGKRVLIGGLLVTVGVLSAAAGAVGVRRRGVAVAVVLVLGAVAGAAALTDRAATSGSGLRLLPVL